MSRLLNVNAGREQPRFAVLDVIVRDLGESRGLPSGSFASSLKPAARLGGPKSRHLLSGREFAPRAARGSSTPPARRGNIGLLVVWSCLAPPPTTKTHARRYQCRAAAVDAIVRGLLWREAGPAVRELSLEHPVGRLSWRAEVPRRLVGSGVFFPKWGPMPAKVCPLWERSISGNFGKPPTERPSVYSGSAFGGPLTMSGLCLAPSEGPASHAERTSGQRAEHRAALRSNIFADSSGHER